MITLLSLVEDLYTQVSAIRPDLFGSYWDYARRYCDAKQEFWGGNVKGSSNSKELRQLLQHVGDCTDGDNGEQTDVVFLKSIFKKWYL